MSRVTHTAACPECQRAGGDTNENNLAVYDDGHSYCYACRYYISPTGREGGDLDFTYEYVPWRGVSADVFRHYGVLTQVDKDGKPISIGYGYPSGDVKVRSIEHKEFYWRKKNDTPPAGLFGRDKFAAGSHKYVVITEGELDACSLWPIVRCPCVSVSSSSSAVRDCSADRSWLQSFERIYLAFDSDTQGREAVRSCAKLFDYDKVFDVKFSNRKDANEYIQHGEAKELLNIWQNSKRYLPESLTSSFSDFDAILEQEPKWGVPYPFPSLTEMTYGIRTGESVLITAQEGVGKTELMHSIEYQILKETDYNVGAIFLEEPPKRHLQALAGIHLQKPVHLPDSGCTSAEVRAAIRELVQKDERLHVHLHFGSDDPDVLLDTIRFLVVARQCRVVLLDHISMVISGLATEDERRRLDYFSTRAEMMVKELDFSLIIVSHVNDFGQTRGSRYIGKIADIRIDATRDVLSPDPTTRNTTHLSVSKNRYSGKTGPACKIWFDNATYTMSEMMEPANDNDPNGKQYGYPDQKAG